MRRTHAQVEDYLGFPFRLESQIGPPVCSLLGADLGFLNGQKLVLAKLRSKQDGFNVRYNSYSYCASECMQG